MIYQTVIPTPHLSTPHHPTPPHPARAVEAQNVMPLFRVCTYLCAHSEFSTVQSGKWAQPPGDLNFQRAC